MGRSNVIIVGSVVLAPLVLGVEGYVLFRSHHHRVAHVAETTPEDFPMAPLPAVEAPPPPVQPAAAPTNDVAAAAPEAVPEAPAPSALEHRRRVIRAADEQAFDILNFPDTQRAAIRAINDAYVRAAQVGDAFVPDGVEQARRAAIAAVLGPNVMRSFSFAERKAERRARSQFRSQSVSQR
jgi:hypothetical protein